MPHDVANAILLGERREAQKVLKKIAATSKVWTSEG
jgi:hypothetical protein